MSPFFFFFNDTATTEIYTLSLHDALPISRPDDPGRPVHAEPGRVPGVLRDRADDAGERRLLRATDPGEGEPHPGRLEARGRSEEHTSELQSRLHLVCRLLLEKKKKKRVRY